MGSVDGLVRGIVVSFRREMNKMGFLNILVTETTVDV